MVGVIKQKMGPFIGLNIAEVDVRVASFENMAFNDDKIKKKKKREMKKNFEKNFEKIAHRMMEWEAEDDDGWESVDSIQ